MKILMPYPPSANRYLRHTARGTYRTSEANKYRASVATRARIAGACMIYNGVQLIATLHPKLTASGKASKTCIDLIDDALRMLRLVEDELLRNSVAEVKDAVLVEQILIEMDALKEAA